LYELLFFLISLRAPAFSFKKKNVEETDENFPWLTIKPVNGIPRLILVIVPHEREPSRIPGPAREEASSSKKKKKKRFEIQPPT
jgi:hypothetical protein